MACAKEETIATNEYSIQDGQHQVLGQHHPK